MSRSAYLKPLGLITGAPDTDAAAAVQHPALPTLAGTGLRFAAVEVIERTGRRTERLTVPLGEFFERDWGRSTMASAALFEAIQAPRPRLAGLSLDRPRIMGIVNVTPDSFSDGGDHATAEAAIAHALKLSAEGADILDIGGESTRPGSETVGVEEELQRVIPVIEGVRARCEARISIDTRKAAVMRAAVAVGADILNDVSALTHDPDALRVAAESGLPVILMHAQGDPKTMNDNPQYGDVVLDVFDYLEQRIADCVAAGIPRSHLVADAGIGFGKHLHHNVAVMASLSLYHGLGVPLMLGASRKKMIAQLCNLEAPKDRVPGSLASALAGISQGVQIVRVHDVSATHQAIAVWRASLAGTEAVLN